MKLRCTHCWAILSKASPTTLHTRDGQHFCDADCKGSFDIAERKRQWRMYRAFNVPDAEDDVPIAAKR
jgi:hypothetical protein